MTDRNRNILIGLFVLVGLFCLAVLIVLFGESRGIFSQRYVLRAKFDRISGVREGTDVKLAGVWVGNVAKVELLDPNEPGKGVYAVMQIDNKFVVPRGSVASVVTPIMGQAAINIIPPPPAAPQAHHPPVAQDGTGEIQGIMKNPLETVIDPKLMATLEKTTAQIGILAEALTPAAKAIEDLLKVKTVAEVDQAPDTVTANLSTAVERLHSVLKHIDTVLGDPEVRSNLKETLANFKAASEEAKLAVAGLKAFSEEAQGAAGSARKVIDKLDTTVDTTHRHIDDLGQRLLLNADKLSRILDYLAAAGHDMAEGEGTVGMLLRDPKFYDELMLTTQRLGAAAAELEVLVKQWQKDGILR